MIFVKFEKLINVENMPAKGSIWRKWDLHVHTPASALNHSLGNDWNTYVERLIDAIVSHQIAVIATADYFTIDGYEKLLTYYDKNNRKLSINQKSTSLYLIPGVELRLNIFNSDEDSINLHILFDPDCCSNDFIRQNFLEQLTVDYRENIGLPLKSQNLLAIGESITKNGQADYGKDFSSLDSSTKNDYIRKALKTITLSYRDIDEALKAIDEISKKQNLSHKDYLIAVVGKGHGGIHSLRWFEENKRFSRAGLIREHLTHQANIIFSNDPKDCDFYLGKRDDTPMEEIEDRFSRLKPCVWGSDAHDLNKLLHPSNGNTLDYTWIKSDASFEGLKQIIYEPELRVRIQQDNPNEKETFAKIENLEINFPDSLKIKNKESNEAIPFCIQGKKDMLFSSNLTCIIGGRGSGKSTMIHILYNLISSRDLEKLTNVNSPLFNLQLEGRDTLSKIRSLTKSDIPSSTEFFLQNEIEKSAKDIMAMSNLIRSRLYSLSGIDDASKGLKQLEDEWGRASTANDSLISAYDELARIDNNIETLEKQKTTLKKQTDVIKSKEYKALQDEIEMIASHISSFDTYEKEVKRITNEIGELVKSIKRLDWNKHKGQSILDSLSIELDDKKSKIEIAFKEAQEKYTSANYAIQLIEKKEQLKQFLENKGLSPENIGEVTSATQQIADLEERIREFTQGRNVYQEIYDQKDELLKNYKEAYSTYRQKFESVVRKLQTNLSQLRFDDQETNITFYLKTNHQLLKDVLTNYIKDSNTSKITLRSDIIQSVLFGNDDAQLENIISDESKISEVINNSKVADVHTQILQDLISNPTFVKKLHLRMQKYHFDIQNIQVQTKLGEKLLQNTSFGERCGIVIAIVLVAGTNPIVIDQPEDNLDGKYISKVLVPLVREQKQKRQIILITRDANIAIGGDSDLMLILDKEQQGMTLSYATIEDKSMRQKYIWILDGGERAFQKREEKYNFRKRF